MNNATKPLPVYITYTMTTLRGRSGDHVEFVHYSQPACIHSKLGACITVTVYRPASPANRREYLHNLILLE